MVKIYRPLLHKFPPHIPILARPPVTIGIRREDPSRIWERRCPLTPDAVQHLISSMGVRVVVQSCDRRVFPIREFTKAGAEINDDLSDAHIVVGIKETPLKDLLTTAVRTPQSSSSSAPCIARTNLMFSHTAKGQPYNTPLLSRFLPRVPNNKPPHILRLAPRLIDYELLTRDPGGKRTVAFGWFAGVAGVLESLSAMAHSHLEIGVASPFLFTPRPHTLPSLDSLRQALRVIGARILDEGTPKKLGPFVIGLTGTGNVSQGCLSILSELPIVNVQVKDLPALVSDPATDLHKIYLVHAKSEDYLTTLDGQKYYRNHYYTSPQSYRSEFAEKIAPYLTLFLNGTGWSPSFPRLMTNEQLTVALHRAQAIGGARFTNVGDISCDVEGGLQFLTRSSTISSPFYVSRPSTLPASLPGVQMMAVDILPATIPLDASKHFSQALQPYLETLIAHYKGESVDMSALDRATIAMNGELMVPHKWLQESVNVWRSKNPADVKASQEQAKAMAAAAAAPTELGLESDSRAASPSQPLRKKKILMLGSGMVAGPAVNEIAKRTDVQLVIASNSLPEVEKLTEEHPNVKYRVINMTDLNTVSKLIEEADVVISLLPVPLHPAAAQLCIQHRKHLVTASYISPEMRKLHEKAVEADVLLLNEIGLDPGIDHCSAISLINRLEAQNKKILSFISFCGGLPAPDVPIVPLRYKFSWSPRGVLAAALNGARYKLNNTIWNIPGENLLRSYFPNVPISKDFDLEGIANRDSLPYHDAYKLGNLPGIRTLLRGTLRYPGFSNLMQSFKSLGLLETQKTIYLERWSSLISQSLSVTTDFQGGPKGVVSAIKSIIPSNQTEPLHEALEWLSLLPSAGPASSLPPLPTEPMTPIDLFSVLLAHKLRYQGDERDMVVLSHEIIAKSRTPFSREEIHTSSLITYGTHSASAMSRTVGLPVAFAALRVLDGKVPVRGVAGPTDPSVYESVLGELDQAGLGMTESVRYMVGQEESSDAEHPIERLLVPGLA